MTTPDLRAQLRTAVGRFRETERRRRRFDPEVHVGVVGGASASVVVPRCWLAGLDRSLRVELVSALVETAPITPRALWLTRPGEVAVTSDDVGWLVGGEAAFGAAGLVLGGCYVVTRHGWVDVRSGDRREWKRLRLQ